MNQASDATRRLQALICCPICRPEKFEGTIVHAFNFSKPCTGPVYQDSLGEDYQSVNICITLPIAVIYSLPRPFFGIKTARVEPHESSLISHTGTISRSAVCWWQMIFFLSFSEPFEFVGGMHRVLR